MNSLARTSSSVNRWLLVVVGCVVLETAQPMKAAEPAPARSADTLLYPGGSAAGSTSETPARAGGAGASWIFAALVGGGAAAWWFWRRRGLGPVARRPGSLAIEETRPLGNRQFLVVASCDGRRFLLGVAPGGIQMLAPLEAKESAHAPRTP